MLHQRPAVLFDLDGTLIDSVYQHVLAWREALESEHIELSVWRIHRKIGMSGGLFTNMLLRETGLHIDSERVSRLQNLHAQAYNRRAESIRPLPGAREILDYLTGIGVRWAIATSGSMETAKIALAMLGLEPDQAIVITRDQVRYQNPIPTSF
jgi:phosphoglycolate phosphatase-like HAD superfamily hydrolase